MEYSRMQAQALQGIAPPDYFINLVSITAVFYDSDDNHILSQTICQMVALTASQVAKQ